MRIKSYSDEQESIVIETLSSKQAWNNVWRKIKKNHYLYWTKPVKLTMLNKHYKNIYKLAKLIRRLGLTYKKNNTLFLYTFAIEILT